MTKPSAFSTFFLPLLAIAVNTSLFYASTTGQPSPEPPQAETRQDQPEAILSHVRSLQSPVVLINFWASWCEPCKEELPALRQLEEKWAEKGLKVVLISIDDESEIEDARMFLVNNNISFTAFYKGGQMLGKFVPPIFPNWSGAVPATVLMNRELKILDAWEGDTTLEEFEDRVKPFLRGKS